jgi:hypothetical protein
MTQATAICKGRQGDWLVDVTINDHTERVPSAHKHFVRKDANGLVYNRPDVGWLQLGKAKQSGKAKQWIAALKQTGRVVVTDDDVTDTGDPDRPYRFTRKPKGGYVAVYTVDEIAINANGCYFRLVDRTPVK